MKVPKSWGQMQNTENILSKKLEEKEFGKVKYCLVYSQTYDMSILFLINEVNIGHSSNTVIKNNYGRSRAVRYKRV